MLINRKYFEETKTDIWCDGWYWHKDRKECIDELLNTEKQYRCIELKDWGD